MLTEGGNVFKDPDGNPVTVRINQSDVKPTVAWLEQLTGLPLLDNMLGSTGQKATSGDLDLAVDKKAISKDALEKQLSDWAVSHGEDPKNWVRKTGTSVHFKTPINGNEKLGFVQTDLMFGDPKFMQFALRGDAKSEFKGQHRMIMMASIAKALGYKWSPTNGLVDRLTNKEVTKDPNEVAKVLLGDGATVNDLKSVETINNKIKSDPNYEALVKDAKEYFEKDGLVLPK